jgi:GNAT superfamily N-acetyltransferase
VPIPAGTAELILLDSLGRIAEISPLAQITAPADPELSWRSTISVLIRAAGPQDVSVLVRLRLANAQHHVELDPAVHRLPDAGAVHNYFTDRLRSGEDELILLAEMDDHEVAGMAEIVVRPDPPEHQILIPRRVAEVHTVILEGHRGRGVGNALLAAVEKIAQTRGVAVLLPVIFAPNDDAARFYTSAGFGPMACCSPRS